MKGFSMFVLGVLSGVFGTLAVQKIMEGGFGDSVEELTDKLSNSLEELESRLVEVAS